MISTKTYHLKLPLEKEKLKEFHVGDILYLSGTIITARDQAYKRIADFKKTGKKLPQPLEHLENCAIYHCGPIIQKVPIGSEIEYKLLSGGPTTSYRMEEFQEIVSNTLKIYIIIGKGGMKSVKFLDLGAMYLSFTGGCGAIFESFVKKVKGAIWEDLGMPETIWILNVENFGPLIVSQDSHGRDLYKFTLN